VNTDTAELSDQSEDRRIRGRVWSFSEISEDMAMFRGLMTFLPVAALLSLTPGAATAMVVHSAVRGGRRRAFFTTAGNSLGVLAWAACAAVGIATVIATSAAAFTAVKLVGGAFLIAMGARSLRRGHPAAPVGSRAGPLTIDSDQKALREGLLTSLANPKLAVFFVALFPQFVPPRGAVFPAALGMATVIVAVDLIWYSILAFAVSRAKRVLVDGPWQRGIDRLTGTVLVGLGFRLALERR
jgi:threonine/homoserine/homoserine lactone efflux protein